MGSPHARVDAEGGFRVTDEHRPLLLLVSEQEPILAELRTSLREAGYLVASSRSVAAAISLLEQVRVDGCILAGQFSASAAVLLGHSLERYTPNCPKLCLPDPVSPSPDGWQSCRHDQLLSSLARSFVPR